MKATISRRRFVAFALLSVMISLVVSVGLLLAVDVYVHAKFSDTGLNIWGYRGPTVGRKRPGEIRIVVAGGSTVLGYGLPWDAAFPHQLELALNAGSAPPAPHFSVVNLGYSNDGAYSFRYTLNDYAYLNYDLAVLYEGYNDLGGPYRGAIRHGVALFRWTGYFPMLPMVATEKMMALRAGDLRAAYRGDKVTFRPNAVARTEAALLEKSLELYKSLEAQATKWQSSPAPPLPDDDGCDPRWAFYCHSMHVGIETAVARHSRVIVVTQPYLEESHRRQQSDLRKMLALRYGSNPRVTYVNLGDLLNIHDPQYCWDGMHLTERGNELVGRALAPAVQAVAASLVQ
ncbi:MAG: SGNH/GDSL hydrolase family protein [Acidobacteria bacterium]|nr:SGNH/GDSL hydrolase family protein [Acidobacteriota bacterium]